VVGIENSKNVSDTLNYIVEKYGINPKLITSDFSPNITGPICEIFGADKLQIDGFHVMQELNRGIRTDLLLYRKELFTNEIQELESLRFWVSNIQKEYNRSGKYEIDLNAIKKSTDLNNFKSQECLQVVIDSIKVLKILELDRFEFDLINLLIKLERSLDENISNFCSKIKRILPKGKITNKGQIRIKNEILKKLKALFLSYRSVLEQKNKKFNKDYWVLFCQPEKMTEKRIILLNEFISDYPELKEYRQITLSIGEIYRQKISEVDGYQIDELKIKTKYSDKLKAAIKTIKKFKDSIIRFSKVFKSKFNLAKASHVSMEYINNKFKAPFKKGYNRSSIENIKRRLSLQMGCEVQFNL